MSSTGGSTPVPPRPEWRAMLAAISALFLILCLCVMVTAARGRGGGIAGAMLRRFADVPLLGGWCASVGQDANPRRARSRVGGPQRSRSRQRRPLLLRTTIWCGPPTGPPDGPGRPGL